MKSFKQKLVEDVQQTYAPKEVTFDGYTTKNLHHSEDAVKSFLTTIDRYNRGQIKDKESILHALKATDTYMKINDAHLEQGQAPDAKELEQWRAAHAEARKHLHMVGEFMHHMDYWHTHEHEVQDMSTNYTPQTVGAEMADSYEPQGDLVEASSPAARFNQKVNQAQAAHEAGDHKKAKYHLDTARNFMLGINSNDHSKIKDSYPKYKELRNIHKEEAKLDEAIKIGAKVKIHAPGKDYHDQSGHVGEIRHGAYKGASKTYTVDYGNGKSVQLDKKNIKAHKEDMNEELTNKTIRSGDKVKVARVIADMLGVENAESMSPEMAINAGLRKMKNKRMTPEMVGVMKKMLNLASEVGVKVDTSLLPKAVTEANDVVVDPESSYNAAKGILSYKDFEKLKKMSDGDTVTPPVDGKPGHTLHTNKDEHNALRRMKIHYKTEAVEHESDDDQSDDFEDLSDEDLEKMANSVDHEDHILHVYDDDELAVIDADTGEEEKEEGVNEQALNEVLSRIERMKAKIRFARTAAKRSRRMQIALKRRSDGKTINKRSRRLAINMIKQRLMKKPATELTVAEKERAERMIQARRGMIDRLAVRLAPRVRKIETDRLSHQKFTK